MIENLGDVLEGRLRPEAEIIREYESDGRRGHSVTGHDLLASAARITAGLDRLGLPRGASVAIASGVGAAHLVALLGVLRAGCIAVPLNLQLGRDGIAHVFADASIIAALTEPGHAPLIPVGVPSYDINTLIASAGAQGASRAPDPGTIALIMYTSGSTGQPKGVEITHEGYVWALSQFLGLRETMSGRTGLVAAPLFHMNGQFHLLNQLMCGARVVLMRRFAAEAFLRIVADEQVHRITGVPAMLALAARAWRAGDCSPLSDVGMVGLGSAPLMAGLVDELGRMFPNAVVTNGYGTTETGPVSFGPHPHGKPTPPLALGFPMPGVALRLEPEGADEGRLFLRTGMTLSAYRNLPELTAERLRDGWYDTGDIVRRDADGFYIFVGRADDMLIVGGENVYPGEVERLLERHLAIAQAAVVAIADEIKGQKPFAFVVTRAGAPFSEAEVKAFTLANGPAYAHPRRIVALDALPLSGVNKVDRLALSRRAAAIMRDMP